MGTVGFGDNYPVTPIEKIYIIIMTVFSCALFAYTVNTIGSILTEYSLKNNKLKKQKCLMLNYMKNRKIDDYL